ncbi:hypothetical protein ON010_g193 [Phytophthora cinnamomi]|nr:hypothetical protein ON010_g193 [Phytophthora cinnamomi]
MVLPNSSSEDAPPPPSYDFPLTQQTPSAATQASTPVPTPAASFDFALSQVTPPEVSPAEAPIGNASPPTAPTTTSTPPASDQQAPDSAPPATASTRSEGRRGSRRRTAPTATRGAGFSPAEVRDLLDLFGHYKPIGRDEWDTVTREHNANFPGVRRTTESLRRKFAKLYRTNMGTGNPYIPEEVERAIALAAAITDRADIAQDDDIEDDANGLFDNDNVDDEGAEIEGVHPEAETSAGVPTARPLVLPRVQRAGTHDGDDDLLTVARAMMLQEQHQREVDREQQRLWREEDRRQREEDRCQRDADRADERERSNRLFELLTIALVGAAKSLQEKSRLSQFSEAGGICHPTQLSESHEAIQVHLARTLQSFHRGQRQIHFRRSGHASSRCRTCLHDAITALLAAQALAHEDFDQAAAQVQRILQYQKPDGLLPHLVYGPSVPSDWHWIPSNRTFHPGPAFWQTAALADQQQEEQEAPSSPLNTSTISAPPVAADVAWEIFRLAPYDSVLGVRTTAVQFLCRVYEPLKKLQKHLFFTRRGPAPSSLLAARHPWETFSSLSPHWKAFLAELKNAPDYETVISSIPKEARTRFADGARSILLAEDAVENLYEPMIYLAAQQRSGGSSDIYTRESTVFDSITEAGNSAAAQFGVEDVEFNALALRSSLGLVNIGRVLLEHSSVCTEFALTQKELLHDMEELQSMAKGLEGALIGNNSTQGLWNASSNFFADSSRVSKTSVHSLRGFLPGYAAELDDDKKMLSMKHFLSEPGSFSFFCTQFPASFFACSGGDSLGGHSTWILYNYFLQRGFARNKFPGLADYVRNKTRDLVCEATVPARTSYTWFPFSLATVEPTPAALALAYDSRSATPVDIFDDSYLGSSLAAAVLLNVLLPAVTPPPSPDTPPIDHRILSVIMCVELVVAFGVAMSCFLFSVYFVANRPRETRLSPASADRRRSSAGTGGKKPRDKFERDMEDRSASGSSWADRYSESSFSDYSPPSGQSPYELEESLISEEDEHYGSFDEAKQEESPSNSAWKAAKSALAAISPW